MDFLKESQNPSHTALIDQFIGLVENAKDLHNDGNTEECLRIAGSAQRLIPQLPSVRSEKITYAINALGIIFFETGYNRDALALYSNALGNAKNTNAFGKS
ncbi:MAG: hypothetical protein ACYSWP_24410 [Planctomycetota bacterium]|jgi:hypothetical protein